MTYKIISEGYDNGGALGISRRFVVGGSNLSGVDESYNEKHGHESGVNVGSSRLGRLKTGLLRHQPENKDCKPVRESEELTLRRKSIKGKNDVVPLDLIAVLHL